MAKNFFNRGNTLPYLGIRFQSKYNVCNMKCPYCICREDKNPAFDFNIFKGILTGINKLPAKVCLQIGTQGEIFTSQVILEEIKNLCNKKNNIFGVTFLSNINFDLNKIIKPFLDSVNTGKLGMGCTLHDLVIEDIDMFFKKVKIIKEKGV
ncbi:MAG: hypothetical protein JSV88_10560, partial [Candidatus Aminicenantes bacterium]